MPSSRSTRAWYLVSLLAVARPLLAQGSGLPPLPQLSCAAGNSALGKPAHEDQGAVEGLYDPQRDSTYLIAYRQTKTTRSFVPFVIGLTAGPGPYDPDSYLLGLTVNADAEGMAKMTDPIPARLVLEDFTTYDLGPVVLSGLTRSEGQVSDIDVVMRLPRKAFLGLVRTRSAVLKWGHWHVDLEASDIGTFRAFERALICAPASLPQVAGGGRQPGLPSLDSPRGTVTDGSTTGHLVDPDHAARPYHSETIQFRTSCPAADSLLGLPKREGDGYLGGKYDEKKDSTHLNLGSSGTGESFSYNLNTSLTLPGRGPFEPRSLLLGFTMLSGLSTAAPWSDTMPVTLSLDDSLTLHPGRLQLSQPNQQCCKAPLQVTILLNREALLALLHADRARWSWANVALPMGPGEIGIVRAFERTLMCAPNSLDPRYTFRGN